MRGGSGARWRCRRNAAVAMTSVLVLFLAACGSSSDSSSKSTTVEFVGDSNILLAQSALAKAAPSTVAYRVVAHQGFGIRNIACVGATESCAKKDYWTQQLAGSKSDPPDVYVVNLGINDTVSLGTASTVGYVGYDKKIDYMMKLFGDTPVLWTNLPCRVEPPIRLRGCTAVNAALQKATGRHDNLTIVDWRRTANPHPEWMIPSVGGVHYWPPGYAAYSNLVFRQIAQRS